LAPTNLLRRPRGCILAVSYFGSRQPAAQAKCLQIVAVTYSEVAVTYFSSDITSAAGGG